ncbi:hypothetical protein [Bacillus multifaciens]|uniref:hypothetical protein n=1 Tax=Bacillus multifaciens TaxID=3068506 RepID=UPI0027404D5D|nr:hypothetical protein [Bacillus sp. WLY-B-L8]MDP7981409.1 hypothetical protein [Bacillus sp. WLY-B-L8]
MEEQAIISRREYMKKWREKNKEKMSNYQKEWRKRNKDKVAKYQERYWEKKAKEMEEQACQK